VKTSSINMRSRSKLIKTKSVGDEGGGNMAKISEELSA